ncbi:hypothetical protein B0T17DRAFT_106394 [Bombardia bombarda]|uniref:Uncharacterized protein n=1 Tax=Bombardia bombarda TaxID=252184 RepID=A0AA39XNS3_9PEZI|nr:hypothetical protein B0T17DRAFT_106394 [Bombardia bombarda]
MKSLSILASLAGLASAVSFANPFIRSGSLEPRVLNGSVLANSSDFANIINNNNNNNGLNLLNPNLNIDGLDLSNLDLTNQNDVAQAIQLMLAGLCLGNVLDLNSILGLGLNNDLELFQELVQLIQLEQLGFLSNGGVRSLFNSGFLLGNFNLGMYTYSLSTHLLIQ